MRYEAERENDPRSQSQPKPDGQGVTPRPASRGTGHGQEGQGTELRPDERGAGPRPQGPGGTPPTGPGGPLGESHRPPEPPRPHQAPEPHRPHRSADAGADARKESSAGTLLPKGEREKIGLRLQQTVNTFVDSPRRSVEEADSLLEETARQLTETLAERRRSLRTTWADESRQAETEELRVALRTYREITERLLQL